MCVQDQKKGVSLGNKCRSLEKSWWKYRSRLSESVDFSVIILKINIFELSAIFARI